MGANIYHTHLHTHTKRAQHKTFIDYLVYLAVVIGPVMTLPQVWEIWATKQHGVSLVTWLAYCLIAVIWLFYGLHHKEKPIIYLQACWLVLDIVIVVGLLVRV